MANPLDITPAGVIGGVVGGATGPVLNAANDSATAQQTNQSQVKIGNPDTYGQSVNATKALQPGMENANTGLGNAAEIEKEIGAPVGQAVKQEGGLDVQESARQMMEDNRKVYLESVQKTNDATVAAEGALKTAAQNATIDPQAYLHSLGTDGKVLTSIGMLFSGIGSGVTGQPNLAYDMYQKNTDRAIKAQQAKFQNLMAASAQSQGLLKTAQDRQAISSNAYNAAVMSVMAGNNAAIQGAQMQIKSTAAPQLIKQIQFENNMKYQNAVDAHSKDYINTLSAGDTRMNKLLGAITVPLAEHFTGNQSFSLNQKPAFERTGPGGSVTSPRMGGVIKRNEPSANQTPVNESPLERNLNPEEFYSDEGPSQEDQNQAFEKYKSSSLFDKLFNTPTQGGGIDTKKFLEKYGSK